MVRTQSAIHKKYQECMNLPVGNKKHNIIYSYLICLKGSKEVSTQEEDREEDQASGKTSSEKKSKPSQLCVIL